MKYVFLFFCFFQISVLVFGADDLKKYLFPSPKQLIINKNDSSFSINTSSLAPLLNSLIDKNVVGTFYLTRYFHGINKVSLNIDSIKFKQQEYEINIDNKGIVILGGDMSSLFYAKKTLLQIFNWSLANNCKIPYIYIRDYPDFQRRGYMLDISRNKVPLLETVYRIVDMLADYKYNEFQLYIEHTFAYSKHKRVWENQSPFTAEEIKLLDNYCKERFIDLVPNQNSFGHMENWLKHDAYINLCDCVEDCNTIWGKRKRHSLDPSNPASLDLMKELYAELLPNFSSNYFNIGCDETLELGLGKSAEICKQKGKGRVYLDYLIALNNEVNKYNKKAQFWGDIINNHSELIPEIPKNMIALVWDYDASYPSKKYLSKYSEAGIDFYVCPGTSSWNSLIGRNDNAFENLKNAALYGNKHGAKGFLITDWGDGGHWQPLSVSYPTILLSAAYAWGYNDSIINNLEFLLNYYIFKDTTNYCAKAVLKLGNAYLKTNIPNGNANAFHLILQRYKWKLMGHYQTKHLNIEGLLAAKTEILDAITMLKLSKPNSYDADIVVKELQLAADIALHSINLGIEQLQAKDYLIENIPKEKRDELITELKPLIQRHKQLWILRNRIGGMDSSAIRFENLLKAYN